MPLLMRILRDRFDFKDVVANVLTFDYLGALAASLRVSDPARAAARARALGAAVRAGERRRSRSGRRISVRRRAADAARAPRGVGGRAGAARRGHGAARARSPTLAEDNIYADEVIFARDTRYQRIVLTAWKDDLRLFLNSHLQFSSRDEYRYHEALVHPGLSALPARATRARARRRRRPGRARDPQVIRASSTSRWSISIRR